MEKICIVKRRSKGIHETGGEAPRTFSEIFDTDENRSPAFEEVKGDKDNAVSFRLTPEQCEYLRPIGHIHSLMEGSPNVLSLDTERKSDGQIIFKFHFNEKKEKSLKLLKPKHVCQMLQISTSFLSKLVKEEKIKSHKLGRLRRFSLDEVIEYLTSN
ncbi:MAG: helix-turn-helix domain-containing protein [Candidatus Scalindua sp.]|nr:helix-turn-helix domain-containing protein [Candidatus Scalindua sp.]